MPTAAIISGFTLPPLTVDTQTLVIARQRLIKSIHSFFGSLKTCLAQCKKCYKRQVMYKKT